MSDVQNEQDVQEIEISMEALKEKIALADALRKLENNQYFKKVILDKYLEDYAIRLVHNKASYAMRSEDQQKYISAQMQGVGQLKHFFLAIMQEGALAEQALKTHEAELESLRQEALQNTGVN